MARTPPKSTEAEESLRNDRAVINAARGRGEISHASWVRAEADVEKRIRAARKQGAPTSGRTVTKRRAAVYTRISKDTGGTGLGVERQRRECVALANARGWQVVHTFTDNDVSAYRGKPRPGLDALREAIGDGEIDALVAWHPDRLTRSPAELENLIDLLEGIDVATVSTGTYDLATPAGRMNARFIGAAARYEVEQKSARQKSKAAELARAGKLGGGGTRPFGYEADRLTPRVSEARILVDAAERIADGASLRAVTKHLNESGVTTTAGKQWLPTSLRRALISPRVAGLREHRGEIVGTAEWPAVIERALWEQVRATLRDPARLTNRSPRRYLLCALVFTVDGLPMIARPNARKIRRYFAIPTAKHRGGAITADELEAIICEAVLCRFDRSSFKPAKPTRSKDAAGLEALEDDLATINAARGRGEISHTSWLQTISPLEDRIAQARKLAGATRAAPAGATKLLAQRGSLRDAWPHLNFEDRRAVITTVIDRIEIGPALQGRNTFDPDRIANIAWKV